MKEVWLAIGSESVRVGAFVSMRTKGTSGIAAPGCLNVFARRTSQAVLVALDSSVLVRSFRVEEGRGDVLVASTSADWTELGVGDVTIGVVITSTSPGLDTLETYWVRAAVWARVE